MFNFGAYNFHFKFVKMAIKKLILMSVWLQCFFILQAAGPSLLITDISDVKLSAALNQKDTAKLFLDGANLKSKLYLTLSGSGAGSFKLSKDSIANNSGTIVLDSVSVFYQPVTEGQHTAVVTISSTDATSVQYNVIGNALGTLTDPWPLLHDVSKRKIRLRDNYILLDAAKGELTELISTNGAVLYTGKTGADGENKIKFPTQKIVLLRIGTEIYKLTQR